MRCAETMKSALGALASGMRGSRIKQIGGRNDSGLTLRRANALKKPGYSAVVLLTLAFGIGVNTAPFTVFNALALKPLPIKDVDSIVKFEACRRRAGERRGFLIRNIWIIPRERRRWRDWRWIPRWARRLGSNT